MLAAILTAGSAQNGSGGLSMPAPFEASHVLGVGHAGGTSGTELNASMSKHLFFLSQMANVHLRDIEQQLVKTCSIYASC
jgi:hypothetical protein